MSRSGKGIEYQVVELGAVRYAVLPETTLRALCRRAGIHSPAAQAPQEPALSSEHLDLAKLAGHLIGRRHALKLSQAELARRAGVRIETLNRIERGKTTPDFSTIRKLVLALKQADLQAVR